MPDDRLLHRCQGFSAKLAELSHLEYRVWTQYLLSADDFGVLPDTAACIRGANLALARAEEGEIRGALDRLVDVGLVVRFEHQGQPYLCSLEWQDFQGIRYPRTTYLPVPSAETFPKLSAKTQELFRNFREKLKTKSGVNHRLTAKGLKKGKGSGEGEDGWAAFWDAYPRKASKREAQAKWSRLAPDASLQAVIMAALAVAKASPQWTKDGGQFVPHASTWLNQRRWEDQAPAKPLVGETHPDGWTRECVWCNEAFEPPKHADGSYLVVLSCPKCAARAQNRHGDERPGREDDPGPPF